MVLAKGLSAPVPWAALTRVATIVGSAQTPKGLGRGGRGQLSAAPGVTVFSQKVLQEGGVQVHFSGQDSGHVHARSMEAVIGGIMQRA